MVFITIMTRGTTGFSDFSGKTSNGHTKTPVTPPFS